MKTIFIKSRDIFCLDRLDDFNSRLYRIELKGEVKVFKTGFTKKKNNLNLIYTLEELDKGRRYFPSYFCLPEALVKSEDGFEGFIMPILEGRIGLDELLNSPDFSHSTKIECLKKVGLILRDCDTLRTKKGLSKFALSDVHEGNFLVDSKTKEVSLIDLDSCKIGSNVPGEAKYLTPGSISNYCRMYKKISKETDLFCYIIMVLNYITGVNSSQMSPDEYYNLLNYLVSIECNPRLVQIFYNALRRIENENPDTVLDSISEDTVNKSREFCKYLRTYSYF